jgi:hypothetical protein
MSTMALNFKSRGKLRGLVGTTKAGSRNHATAHGLAYFVHHLLLRFTLTKPRKTTYVRS